MIDWCTARTAGVKITRQQKASKQFGIWNVGMEGLRSHEEQRYSESEKGKETTSSKIPMGINAKWTKVKDP